GTLNEEGIDNSNGIIMMEHWLHQIAICTPPRVWGRKGVGRRGHETESKRKGGEAEEEFLSYPNHNSILDYRTKMADSNPKATSLNKKYRKKEIGMLWGVVGHAHSLRRDKRKDHHHHRRISHSASHRHPSRAHTGKYDIWDQQSVISNSFFPRFPSLLPINSPFSIPNGQMKHLSSALFSFLSSSLHLSYSSFLSSASAVSVSVGTDPKIDISGGVEQQTSCMSAEEMSSKGINNVDFSIWLWLEMEGEEMVSERRKRKRIESGWISYMNTELRRAVIGADTLGIVDEEFETWNFRSPASMVLPLSSSITYLDIKKHLSHSLCFYLYVLFRIELYRVIRPLQMCSATSSSGENVSSPTKSPSLETLSSVCFSYIPVFSHIFPVVRSKNSSNPSYSVLVGVTGVSEDGGFGGKKTAVILERLIDRCLIEWIKTANLNDLICVLCDLLLISMCMIEQRRRIARKHIKYILHLKPFLLWQQPCVSVLLDLLSFFLLEERKNQLFGRSRGTPTSSVLCNFVDSPPFVSVEFSPPSYIEQNSCVHCLKRLVDMWMAQSMLLNADTAIVAISHALRNPLTPLFWNTGTQERDASLHEYTMEAGRSMGSVQSFQKVMSNETMSGMMSPALPFILSSLSMHSTSLGSLGLVISDLSLTPPSIPSMIISILQNSSSFDLFNPYSGSDRTNSIGDWTGSVSGWSIPGDSARTRGYRKTDVEGKDNTMHPSFFTSHESPLASFIHLFGQITHSIPVGHDKLKSKINISHADYHFINVIPILISRMRKCGDINELKAFQSKYFPVPTISTGNIGNNVGKKNAMRADEDAFDVEFSVFLSLTSLLLSSTFSSKNSIESCHATMSLIFRVSYTLLHIFNISPLPVSVGIVAWLQDRMERKQGLWAEKINIQCECHDHRRQKSGRSKKSRTISRDSKGSCDDTSLQDGLCSVCLNRA
ncbi:hypothetical protein ADUPG1_009578, partial [Aduncisulcus paluster]